MNKQKSKKFNSIDVLIILFFLVIITMVVARLYFGDKAFDREQNAAELHFIAEEITPTIKNGDIVLYNGEEIGKIVGEPYNEFIYYIDDVQDTSRADVSAIISAKGKFTDKGFLLNGKTFVAKGKKMQLVVGRHLVTVTITDVIKV